MDAHHDDEDWLVEGDERRLIRPVRAPEDAPGVHRSHRREFERARAARAVVIAVVAVLLIVAVPAGVRWARDSLAEITQTTTTVAP